MEGVDTESSGRLLEKRYKHLNPPAAFHIEEKWGMTNDLDVFAQLIDIGTAKQKEMVSANLRILLSNWPRQMKGQTCWSGKCLCFPRGKRYSNMLVSIFDTLVPQR